MSLLWASCGKSYEYEMTQPVAETGWANGQALSFDINATDSVQVYNLYLDVAYNQDYPFQNLYFDIETTFPDGKKGTQMLGVDLFDKSGKCQGECSRKACTLSIVLREGLRFNALGSHKLVLSPRMRQSLLPGLVDFSIKMEKQK